MFWFNPSICLTNSYRGEPTSRARRCSWMALVCWVLLSRCAEPPIRLRRAVARANEQLGWEKLWVVSNWCGFGVGFGFQDVFALLFLDVEKGMFGLLEKGTHWSFTSEGSRGWQGPLHGWQSYSWNMFKEMAQTFPRGMQWSNYITEDLIPKGMDHPLGTTKIDGFWLVLIVVQSVLSSI